MKTTLILTAAAALARVALASPIQYSDPDNSVDFTNTVDDDYDDECGAPEPETSSAAAASSAPASAGPSAVPSPSSVSSFVTSILSSSAAAASSIAPTSSVAAQSSSSSAISFAPASASSSAAAVSSAASSAAASPSSTGSSSGGPNPYSYKGMKAGLSGFVGIADNDQTGFSKLAPYMGWYSDYTATTPDSGNVKGIPMLWGDGQTCTSDTDDVERLQAFQSNTSSYTPAIMMGFYEPDCDCPMSSNIQDPTVGATQWNSLIAPLADKGTALGSPSMCKQYDEDWLQPFLTAGAADWDVTNIHVNKNSLEGVQKDIGHYMQYGKPIWVAELACVDDSDGQFNPCTDQGEIDSFLSQVIPWLQANDSVIAYGPSNGEGLGDVWPLFTDSGDLSATGQSYLSALQSL